MARPRLPDAVKKARGTLQKCRTVPNAANADPCKVPAPPKGLTADERKAWAALAQACEELGTFSMPYLPAFELLVSVYSSAMNPSKDDSGATRSKYASAASSMLARFGLDPASAGRISVVKKTAKDETAALLFTGPRLVASE